MSNDNPDADPSQVSQHSVENEESSTIEGNENTSQVSQHSVENEDSTATEGNKDVTLYFVES